MSGFERVLFVHAHPDDESITTGGTIATLVDRGAQVTVITATRGERGEVIPAELAHLEGSPDLAAHREGELAAALEILGVTDHRYLGSTAARRAGCEPRIYADSGMQWGPGGAEPSETVTADSLCAAEFAEVVDDIAAVLALVQPDAVVSYDKRGGYGHPDHVRAHRVSKAAADAVGIPFFVIADGPDAVVVDVSAGFDRKREAMRAHRTQISIDGDSFALSSGGFRPIERVESFVRCL